MVTRAILLGRWAMGMGDGDVDSSVSRIRCRWPVPCPHIVPMAMADGDGDVDSPVPRPRSAARCRSHSATPGRCLTGALSLRAGSLRSHGASLTVQPSIARGANKQHPLRSIGLCMVLSRLLGSYITRHSVQYIGRFAPSPPKSAYCTE